MVFSSLLFIFVFLTLNLLVYARVRPERRNVVLLTFSLVFYAWGGPAYLFLLAGEVLVSWAAALLISRTEGPGLKRVWLIACLVILLGLLGVFKYTGFFAQNLHALFGVPKEIPQIVLPIGISFYTFQLISYVVDVYRGTVQPQTAYWKLLLYASLFHQCIAGPIVRYETIADEIDNRQFTRKGLDAGIRRFCVGLAKKAVLANACASVADTLAPVGAGTDALAAQTTLGLWLGMIFYMLQIYLDFSAYSDMAIGLGRMVGFHYLENFDHPYQCCSVQDFWRRWHISLSSFFRDYVYIPLGGSRVPTPLIVRNLAVVWFLTGFWHGASWNFIFWGLYFFGFLMLERFVIGDYLKEGPGGRIVGHVYSLLVVLIGWVLFRFTDTAELFGTLGHLIVPGKTGFTNLATNTTIMANIFLLIFSVLACTELGTWIRKRMLAMAATNEGVRPLVNFIEAATPLCLLLVSVVALVGNSYNPFLYFRF